MFSRYLLSIGGYMSSSYDEESLSGLNPKKSKEGKLRLCSKALHPEFSYPLINVAEMSIEKGYKPLNWLVRNSPATNASYTIEAAQRHLDKVKLGVDFNTEETKQDGSKIDLEIEHAAQVAYNMLMFCLIKKKGILNDDRLFRNGGVIDD